MFQGLFKLGLGLLVASGIAITGCTSAAKASGPNPAPSQPPAQTAPAPAPKTQFPSLQDLAPTDSTYKSLNGTLIHWKVTRNGDQVRVEEWTQSEEFGPMLHVHLVRSFGPNQFIIDEFYKAGVGLFSRTVKDKSGKVVDQLKLRPSK